MMRLLAGSSSGKSAVGYSSYDDKSTLNGDDVTINEPVEPLPESNLSIKKLDFYYSTWTKTWKYKNSGEKEPAQAKGALNLSKFKPPRVDDPWRQYCFVSVRSLPDTSNKNQGMGMSQVVSYQIHIKNPYLIEACKEVKLISEAEHSRFSDNSPQLHPHSLLSCLPRFEQHREALAAKGRKLRTDAEDKTLPALETLIKYLRNDWASTLSSVQQLTARGQIAYRYLDILLKPQSILVTTCPVTGEPQAVRLVSVTQSATSINNDWMCITCVYIDKADTPEISEESVGYHYFTRTFNVSKFEGVKSIDQLPVFPIEYHPDPTIRERLIARGKKWFNFDGMHHVQYKGMASFTNGTTNKKSRYDIDSRVMIDRANFKRLKASDYSWQQPTATGEKLERGLTRNGIPPSLTDDDLLLTTPVLFGFSFVDKLWLELDVTKVTDIQWDNTAFENLVIPDNRKALLRSLVEAHKHKGGVDDFVRGKGQGLVINLFGPPGTGKTLSAEATSEQLKKPLYVVGLGDLGIETESLEQKLIQVFELATTWDALILLDEADVFLQQRNMQDLQRNAMIAVFLRHLEYYRGILFLTTNRVKAYDDAFLSRIHVSLRFHALTPAAKRQVWISFLGRAAADEPNAPTVDAAVATPSPSFATITNDEQLDWLSAKNINGREIKNAVRTAQSLARSRSEPLRYAHLVEVLELMEQFDEEFDMIKDD